MTVSLAASLVLATLSLYPAYGDRPALRSATGPGDARLEAVIDKGPLLELIVACPQGTAILSYSKVERLFCGPRPGCERTLAPAVQRACGG